MGAGLGATTAALCDGSQRSWLCIEPDPAMVAYLAAAVAAGRLPSCCRVLEGTVRDLPKGASFDAVLYVDVLEHVEMDARELASAAAVLKPGGKLVVLAPAHRWLYSPFDAAIGHHRRYTRRTLARVAPPALTPVRLDYLDSVGLLASAANRAVLRQALPTSTQIDRWDRWMIPLSRRLDPMLGFAVGKSVLGIWRAAASPAAGGDKDEAGGG